MGLILQALGLVFLLFLILVVFVVLTIRAKIRKFVRGIETVVQAVGTPARIHLVQVSSPSWENEADVRRLADPLPGLGFEPAGTYDVQEIAGMRLQAWVKPSESVTAVVYDSEKAGVWLDLYTRFEDGTRVIYGNAAKGEGVDQAPGHEVVRLPGLETRDLYERFMAGRPEKPARPIDAAGFPTVFETTYADEMDWRNSRGDGALGELRALAAQHGVSPDDPRFEQLRAIQQSQAIEGLNQAVRERFLRESSMSAAEWERVRDRLVVIHDRLTPEMLDETVSGWVEDGFGAPASPPPGYSIRRAFEEFNAALPDDQRFVRLGEVKEPVEAEVYSAPGG